MPENVKEHGKHNQAFDLNSKKPYRLLIYNKEAIDDKILIDNVKSFWNKMWELNKLPNSTFDEYLN